MNKITAKIGPWGSSNSEGMPQWREILIEGTPIVRVKAEFMPKAEAADSDPDGEDAGRWVWVALPWGEEMIMDATVVREVGPVPREEDGRAVVMEAIAKIQKRARALARADWATLPENSRDRVGGWRSRDWPATPNAAAFTSHHQNALLRGWQFISVVIAPCLGSVRWGVGISGWGTQNRRLPYIEAGDWATEDDARQRACDVLIEALEAIGAATPEP